MKSYASRRTTFSRLVLTRFAISNIPHEQIFCLQTWKLLMCMWIGWGDEGLEFIRYHSWRVFTSTLYLKFHGRRYTHCNYLNILAYLKIPRLPLRSSFWQTLLPCWTNCTRLFQRKRFSKIKILAFVPRKENWFPKCAAIKKDRGPHICRNTQSKIVACCRS